MLRNWGLVAVCAALALVAACKKASESAAERAVERAIERGTGNKANVDVSQGQIKVTGKEDGKEFSFQASDKGGSALPKDFPGDLPRFPGATVMSSLVRGDDMVLVNFESTAAMDEVSEFYGAKLRGGGWEIINEMAAPEMRMINGKKGDRETSVTIHSDGRKTGISVVYSGGKG